MYAAFDYERQLRASMCGEFEEAFHLYAAVEHIAAGDAVDALGGDNRGTIRLLPVRFAAESGPPGADR